MSTHNEKLQAVKKAIQDVIPEILGKDIQKAVCNGILEALGRIGVIVIVSIGIGVTCQAIFMSIFQ